MLTVHKPSLIIAVVTALLFIIVEVFLVRNDASLREAIGVNGVTAIHLAMFVVGIGAVVSFIVSMVEMANHEYEH